MVSSSSSPSHNTSVQNHVEPQRHHTISRPTTTSGWSSNSDRRSNGSTNLTAQTSSPTKSSSPSSANSSPKMGKRSLSTSTSSSRPRRHAPLPPSGATAVGNGAVGGAHLSRKNKSKSPKDNRYSLQVDPRDFHDNSFRSLPRRKSPGPVPPTRNQSIPQNPMGSSTGTKPPLHPSASLGSASSLQDARLAGYSSFVNPHQTGSSTLQPVSAPVRRYSSDAATPSTGTLQLTPASSEARRSSTGEVTAAAQQPASDVQHQHAQSASSGNIIAVSNHPRSGSNQSSISSSPSSPTKDRSRSASKERDFHHLGPAPIVKLDLPTSFSNNDGMELVEVVRKKTGVSHRKSVIAINEVLEFF